MRVSLNANVLRHGTSGTAVALSVLEQSLRQIEDVHLSVLRPPNRRTRTSVGRAYRDIAWDLYSASRCADDGVIIHPANVGLGRRNLRTIVVMHDVMVLEHPSRFDRRYVAYARAFFGLSARRAEIVLTPSEVSAEKIRAHWPKARTEVVPWPVRFGRVPAARDRVPERLRVLVIGATEPHKRVSLAIETVRLARLATGVPLELAILGPVGRDEERVLAATAIADPAHDWIERVIAPSDDVLLKALDDAWVLFAASEDEGFCLPLVEAAARALPVVHTGAGAMREVMPLPYEADSAHQLADVLEALLDARHYNDASEDSWLRATSFGEDLFTQRLGDVLRAVA
jgi:glycosyltransferase involved in cell wall biosynthesis